MLASIPTNIITGFLGVGKTTAILHLLKTKPKNERWAILVNEFGEIGIDGEILSAQQAKTNDAGIFIKEVSGGCMCCAAGVPMQVALKNLLLEAKPDRLLIEPTGLGHPKEVIKVLSAAHYKTVLSLENTITLIDARNISDERYTSHEIFNQQIEVADVIVANKAELYQTGDQQALLNYIEQKQDPQKNHKQRTNKTIHFVSHGEIKWQWLNQNSQYILKNSTPVPIAFTQAAKDKSSKIQLGHQAILSTNTLRKNQPTSAKDRKLPESGYLCIQNKDSEHHAIGWRFKSSFIFDHENIITTLNNVGSIRAKAVLHTTEGTITYNRIHADISMEKIEKTPLDKFADNNQQQESYIELIFLLDEGYGIDDIDNVKVHSAGAESLNLRILSTLA